MSPKTITSEIVKRHPELKEFTARQLRLVKKVIKDAVTLSTLEVLNINETEQAFQAHVPDSNQPSAALRAYRKRNNLTQRELSKKCGIPQPHIAAMESGTRVIGLMVAKKFALALGIDYRKLI